MAQLCRKTALYLLLFVASTLLPYVCFSDNQENFPEENTQVVGQIHTVCPEPISVNNAVVVYASPPIKRKSDPAPPFLLEKSISYSIKDPTLISIPYPVKNQPGKGVFSIPDTIEQLSATTLSLAPEIRLVKDAYSKDNNPYNFISYSTLQGLPHNQARTIIQDKEGSLWIGTDDGLTRYDGKFFYNYSTGQGLSNSHILALFQDSKENIWIGTFRGGVIKFDGVSYTTFSSFPTLSNGIINDFTEDKEGNIWIASGDGLIKYNGQSFVLYNVSHGLPANEIRAVDVDGNGNIIAGTWGGGLSFFDENVFSNYTRELGFPDTFISSLYVSPNGTIWIGTANNGIVRFNGTVFFQMSEEHGLIDETIRAITGDSDESVWIGTTSFGISELKGNIITNYGSEQGLASDYIRSLLIDRDNNLWIGTRVAGLSRFNGFKFTHFTEYQGISNNRVMSVMEESPDVIWLGTYGGHATLIQIDNSNGIVNRTFYHFGQKQGLLGSRIYSIIKDSKGNIWFGTDGSGITKYDGINTYTYTVMQGLASNTIRDIIEDDKGNIWCTTYGYGLSVFDGTKFTNYTIESGLSTNTLLSLYKDTRGRIWISTDGQGVICYDGESFCNYTPDSGFGSDIVYSIAEDSDGYMLFGTGGDGIIRYKDNSFTKITVDHGLYSNHVLALKIDEAGNIWAGTRNGLNIITDNGDILGYSHADGYIGTGCNLGAIEFDSYGNVWIGTNDRLTKFHGSIEPARFSSLNLAITAVDLHYSRIAWPQLLNGDNTVDQLPNGVKVGKISFDGVSKWNNLPVNLKMTHINNSLTFHFNSVSFNQSTSIPYQFKMDGTGENWNSANDINQASYVNLKPGRYVFRVRTLGSNGEWNIESSFPFTIKPPLWKTMWFYLFLFIAISLLIYKYILHRENKLKRDNELLEEKVEEKTHELLEKNNELLKSNAEKDKFFSIVAHDLKGPFNGFLGLTHLLAQEGEEFSKEQIKDIAENMENSASSIYTLLENLLNWSKIRQSAILYNSSNQKIKPLVSEVLATLYQTIKSKEVTVNINITDTISIYADPNMFMTIMRNLISNALKFTNIGGTITVGADVIDNTTVKIWVEDTGVGMDAETVKTLFNLNMQNNRKGTEGEPSTGLGLIICKDFVERHGGSIWAESEPGKGSKFCFTLKS